MPPTRISFDSDVVVRTRKSNEKRTKQEVEEAIEELCSVYVLDRCRNKVFVFGDGDLCDVIWCVVSVYIQGGKN